MGAMRLFLFEKLPDCFSQKPECKVNRGLAETLSFLSEIRNSNFSRFRGC